MRFCIVLLASSCSLCCVSVWQGASRHTAYVRRELEDGSSNEDISATHSPSGILHLSSQGEHLIERHELPVRTIRGINVYNYDRPHRNKRLLLDYDSDQSDWIISLKSLDSCTDAKIQDFCNFMTSQSGLETVICSPRGHSLGVPFLELRATLEEINAILLHDGAFQNECIKDCDADTSVRAVLEEKPTVRADESAIEVGATSPYVSQYQFAPPWNLDSLDEDPLDAKYDFGKCIGEGAHVYIIDTGIRTSHVDFHGRAHRALECLSSSGTVCKECSDAMTNCAHDVHGHGTHAAGIVGGMFYGVAKEVTMHSVKILNDEGEGSISWAIEALDWVVRHAKHGDHPAVALLSFWTTTQSMSLAHAVDVARSNGITVVASAGHGGVDACRSLLARENSAVIVGASTKESRIAEWSNHGKCVDIFAPGQDIMTTGLPPPNNVAGADSLDAYKAIRSGTSLAAAHVAGAAAKLLSCTDSSYVKAMLIEKSKPALVGALGESPNSFLSCLDP